ncbi:high-affinity nicotinic acid transporter [[Candida] anglica]|uniref:High-affinity nicotinic acid transporter n=1 Tax=[Candida] anglica TaxID=148631 RepID=A0ABP0EC37_9ASCO
MAFANIFKRKISTPDIDSSSTSIENEKNANTRVNLTELESLSSGEKKLDHIFQDPVVAAHYREVYENTNYECKDYFDPEFTWTEEEERRVGWKIDWYVTFWAFAMFMALDIDRYNIQQALSDNMLDDLNLTTNDYNLGKTVNLVSFLAAELPSQLISKWIGPDIWIPAQLVLWSAVSMSQAWMKGRQGFLVTRALVGALQGGFIPDVCLWMSYFYTSKEFPSRLSLFYIANPLGSIVASLLAFALLKVNTSGMKEGWRWLFLIEGAATLIIGIMSFFKMPASVVQTKTWYRKKGWFTEREELLIVNKVLRDDPSKGDMHNREPVGPKELLTSLLDYDLWPVYFIRILGDIGSTPVQSYLTLTLRKLGFSTFDTNALTIPANVLQIISMVITGWLSEIVNQRAYALAITPIWVLACLFPLRYWKGAQKDIWGTYTILTILLGHTPTWPLSISWISANSNSVRARAVSAAIVNMFSQAGAIASANIYRMDDAPLYHRGNEQLIAIAFGALAMCIISKIYYIQRNKYKERKWSALTIEEQEDYISNSTDEGNKRLDFRFVH